MPRSGLKQFVLVLGALISTHTIAAADEGGVSFWIPGFFGSLAAAPQQPGWSLTSFYYHTSVSAGADVARAREFEIGRIPVNLTANVSASLDARADRKSTRLNSSHLGISYAVFCLKKKK